MLVLTRRTNQSILINDNLEFTIGQIYITGACQIKHNNRIEILTLDNELTIGPVTISLVLCKPGSVRIGFEMASTVKILRKELLDVVTP